MASRRIRRYAPHAVLANVLAPLPHLERFESAGLCYLLHCLPGAMAEKSAVFDHLARWLAPGARVFGATIVQGDVPRSRPAQVLMDLYNRKGIFSNADDSVQALDLELRGRFRDVEIALKGSVALFEARAP